jgi:hypothetical protein
MKSSIIIVAAGIIALAIPSSTAGDDSWNNLGRVNRERVYSFALRNGECLQARIKDLHTDMVDVVPRKEPGTSPAPQRTIHRDEIAMVSDGVASWQVIFNNRSSWLGTCSIPGFSNVHLRVTLRSGVSATGRPAGCIDSAIRIREISRIGTFAKKDVREVDLIRMKPGPPKTPQFIRKVDGSPLVAAFYPSEWPSLLERISVRLYDSPTLEDSSSPACAVLSKTAPN